MAHTLAHTLAQTPFLLCCPISALGRTTLEPSGHPLGAYRVSPSLCVAGRNANGTPLQASVISCPGAYLAHTLVLFKVHASLLHLDSFGQHNKREHLAHT